MLEACDRDPQLLARLHQEDDLVADAFVVICKEGVAGPDGKEVKRNKVAGSWNEALIISEKGAGQSSDNGKPASAGDLDLFGEQWG